jgi:hypothetical protein
MNANLPRTITVSLVAALVAGCNAYPRLERDFGNSVRHMVDSQKVNTGPVDTTPVETGDGERLNNALGAYRSGVTRPEQSGQPVVLDFGSATSR